MQRLNEKNINTPEEYDRIFEERRLSGVDRQDVRRWKRLIRYFRGGKILDIGCLDSLVYPLIKKQSPLLDCRYLGIDIAKKSIKSMSDRYANDQSVRFEVRDCYNTGLPDEFFDYVIMGEVIEHLDKPIVAMMEALRVLKPKGMLAISTPNNEASEVGAVDSHRHLWSYTAQSLTKILKPFGRVTSAILGSEYFPRYKYHFPTLIIYVRKK